MSKLNSCDFIHYITALDFEMVFMVTTYILINNVTYV